MKGIVYLVHTQKSEQWLNCTLGTKAITWGLDGRPQSSAHPTSLFIKSALLGTPQQMFALWPLFAFEIVIHRVVSPGVYKWEECGGSADLAYSEEARHWAPSSLTKARHEAEGGDWKGKDRVWFLRSTCLFLAKAPVTQIDGCISHVGPICLPAVQWWLNPFKKRWLTVQLSAGNNCAVWEFGGSSFSGG